MWHERLLLYPSSRDKSFWVCATPDSEENGVCEEAFLETSPDSWAIAAWGLLDFQDSPQPAGQQMYNFEPMPSLKDIRPWLKEAIRWGKQLLKDKQETPGVEPQAF